MEWRQEIETEFGGSVFDTGFSGGVITSGSLIVDFLSTIGGFPLGGIVEIFGDEGSGKTTLALSCLKEALAQKRPILWLDYERTLSHDYMRKIGLDAKVMKDYLISPDTMEDGFMIMKRFCEQHKGGVMAVDSVAAMPPVGDIEKMKEIIGQVRVASQAAVMSISFRQMAQFFKKSDVCAIFLNQERANVDTTGRNPGNKTTPGGVALKFYSSMRVKLETRQAVKVSVEDAVSGGKVDEVIGIELSVTVIKNKLAPSYRRSRMYLRMDEGIDNLRSALQIAELTGSVVKRGAFYTIDSRYSPEIVGGFKAHGYEQMRKYFIAHPKDTERLFEDVKLYLQSKQKKEITDERSD